MNNRPNILALFLLLVHLAGWLVWHLPQQQSGAVVLKKRMSPGRNPQAGAAKKKSAPQTRKTQVATHQENKTSETKAEIKICPVKLAQPPVTILLAYLPFPLQPEPKQFRQNPYYFLSVSEEPDPPRFA